MDRNRLMLGLTIWLLALCMFGALAFGLDTRWTLADEGNRADQCERLRPASTVLELQNTWSNAGYLLAGIFILLSSRKPLGLALGVHLSSLALFSGLYHASLQPLPQTLDVGGIYCVLLALLLYGGQSALVHLRGYQASWQVEAAAIVGTPLVGYGMAWARRAVCLFDSTTVVVIFVVLILGLCLRLMYTIRLDFTANPALYLYFLAGLPAALVSFVVRLTDGDDKPLCLLDGMLGLVQAHAAWHVLGALTLLMLYDLFAWIAADDYRIFGDSVAQREPGPYPKAAMGGLAIGAGAFFVTDGLLGLKFVIPNPDDCVLWAFVVGIPLIIVGVLTLLGVIKP